VGFQKNGEDLSELFEWRWSIDYSECGLAVESMVGKISQTHRSLYLLQVVLGVVGALVQDLLYWRSAWWEPF
jgi:hypothetical protein